MLALVNVNRNLATIFVKRQPIVSETLAARLAQARREMGVREWRDVRRSEIAKAADVDPSMVTHYEQGRSIPREDILERLAAFFGTTPRELRYGPEPVARARVDYGRMSTATPADAPIMAQPTPAKKRA
jgi:transcriptional regulator with XRE-family HTH domain